ncbi:uncharacterized protein IAS62_001640 [Cryptococcus decagattii]|uniref:Uncharacterized protein n=1 Tax=Cryptococcus decagattii TaxID=1859122 RepID=A0ABZ2ASN5_9TREE
MRTTTFDDCKLARPGPLGLGDSTKFRSLNTINHEYLISRSQFFNLLDFRPAPDIPFVIRPHIPRCPSYHYRFQGTPVIDGQTLRGER